MAAFGPNADIAFKMTFGITDGMNKRLAPQAFTVAPYCIDGSAEGQGVRRIADLSTHWIGVCSNLIAANGLVADQVFDGQLSHLRLKYAATAETALVTIFVHDRAVLLAAIVSGGSVAADAEVLRIFAESLARSTAAFTNYNDQSFAGLADISDRPLLIVVPWPDPLITDQEHDLAKELMLHFAAAFLFSS